MIPKDARQSNHRPTKPGWYECWALDDRWGGEMRYRAWGNGYWWIPLVDGWITSPMGIYRWRGPVADVNGPAPDGTNPQSTPQGDARAADSALQSLRCAVANYDRNRASR